MNYSKYSNIIFDFDGVIADSNFIKEKCITKASQSFCDRVLHQRFVEYFIANNGIPREIKIEKFFNSQDSKKILIGYEESLKSIISTISVTKGVKAYLSKLKEDQTLYILSGGVRDEIEQVLLQHGLKDFFSLLMSGPKTKEENIENIVLNGSTLFIGDSQKDYEVAMKYNFDFIFMYGYTQFREWREFFLDKEIKTIRNFEELLYD